MASVSRKGDAMAAANTINSVADGSFTQQQREQQQVAGAAAQVDGSTPEVGFAPHVDMDALAAGSGVAAAAGAAPSSSRQQPTLSRQRQAAVPMPPDPAAASTAAAGAATADAGLLYPPLERTQIRNSWNSLMRWSRYFRQAICLGCQCS